MNIMVVRHGKRKILVVAALVLLLLFMSARSVGNSVAEAVKDVSASKLPIYATDDDTMRISMTINCAWGADDIPDILEVLDHYNIKATFFVLGIWAEKYPDALKMIYAKGHDIGNHSYSHRLPSQSTAQQLATEIDRCNEIVESIVGVRPVFYRAPSGDYTDTLLSLTDERRMLAIQWSADSVDWKKDVTKEALIGRILNDARSGGILLFHNDTQYTLEALPTIIERLQERGFSFVKLSDLVYTDGYFIDSRGVQTKKH